MQCRHIISHHEKHKQRTATAPAIKQANDGSQSDWMDEGEGGEEKMNQTRHFLREQTNETG